MHIVGLLGMPRRVYTYPGDMGWTAYNLAETIGGFITLAGILLLFGNLVASYRRGPLAGRDPWRGPTLEWTVPSPPPPYNFAAIPVVASGYPNWEGTRAGDPLDDGHRQVASTVVDGYLDEIVDMPHSSPWPIVVALCLSAVFAVLLVGKYTIAGVFAVLLALALVAWHWKEGE
jgi:cytochrome c oxidase subunit 1/cytochrome c oxidase subunit I+III